MIRTTLLAAAGLLLAASPVLAGPPPITARITLYSFEEGSGPYGMGQISYGSSPENGINSACWYNAYLLGENPQGYDFFEPNPWPFPTETSGACYNGSVGKCQVEVLMSVANNGSGCQGSYTQDLVIPVEADNFVTHGSNPNYTYSATDIADANGLPIQSSKGSQCAASMTTDSTNNVFEILESGGYWPGVMYFVGNQLNAGVQCDH
jgi:hypothetical protein